MAKDRDYTYGEWLEGKKKELAFKWSDLSESTGISQSMLRNYRDGNAVPREKNRERIEKFIKSQYYFENFMRIPNEEFSGKIDRLLEFFKNQINENQLGRKVGLSQAQISKIRYGNTAVDTQTQRNMLEVFYKLCCDKTGSVISAVSDIGYELGSIFSNRYIDMFTEQFDEDCEENNIFKDCEYYGIKSVMMFDDYPEFIQEIILENIRAFCDNLYYGIQGIYFHSFDDYKEEIELYRYFSEEGRKDLINKLNYGTKIPFFYPKNSEENEYLLQLSDYQRMILIAKNGQHMFPGDLYDNYSSDAERDEYVANYKKELEQGKKLSPKTMKFAKLCSHMFDFDVISEIQFKLAMSSEEWYLWMMMVIARFNDVDYREMLSEEQPDDPF